MNEVLHHLPLNSDFSLHTEQECGIGSVNFASEGIREGSTAIFPHSSNRGVRCFSNKATAYDPPYSDSRSGSISTSPSSTVYGHTDAAQSIACLYPTTSPLFSSQYSLAQPFGGMTTDRPRLASIIGSSTGILPSARSPGLPVSPTCSARDNYATSTPGINKHLVSPRSGFDTLPRPAYNFPDTPRSMISTASMISSPTYRHPVALGADRRDSDAPPFLEQENFHSLFCEGQQISARIEAKIEKGFFRSSDNSFTCYRRRMITLIKSGEKVQHAVQAMAVSLSAAVDGAGGKAIELVQHTPKRDRGPQTPVGIIKLSPAPPGGKLAHAHPAIPHGYPLDTFGQPSQVQPPAPPLLPLQTQSDSNATSSEQDSQSQYAAGITAPNAHQHTFERIQFKSATANNGKRRAQQQYYHLIVELYVDIRDVDAKGPNWVKIAHRVSHAVVVRGRSPSHYSNEGPHSARSSGGASGGGSGLGLGGMMRAGQAPGFGNGVSYSSSMNHQAYRGSTFTLDPSPMGSCSTHLASPISSGHIDSTSQSKPVIVSSSTEDGYKSLEHIEAYQYYPSPIYDSGIPQTVKSDEPSHTHDPTTKEGVSPAFPPGGVASAWNLGRCGSFPSLNTTRGYYPSVDTGY